MAKRTPSQRGGAGQGPAAAELATVLREAITRLNRRVRQARPVGDLTATQLNALGSVELGGALTPRELADTERVQPPTMTKIIARLEERGLLRRTPHPTDRRQVILSATEEGRAVLLVHQRARDEWLTHRLAELGAEERDTLRRAADILEKLARG